MCLFNFAISIFNSLGLGSLLFNLFSNSYCATPIGLFDVLKAYSTVKLFLSAHNIIPIDGFSSGSFSVSSNKNVLNLYILKKQGLLEQKH